MPSLIVICRGGTWEHPELETIQPKPTRPCPPLGATPEWKTAVRLSILHFNLLHKTFIIAFAGRTPLPRENRLAARINSSGTTLPMKMHGNDVGVASFMGSNSLPVQSYLHVSGFRLR